MYRKGYFRQRIDASGWQHEYWLETDPERLPAALVTGADGEPLTVSAPIGESDVTARIWRVDVGRVPLFLLDTDCPENGPVERWITGRLYDGDPQTRLAQYALLGVGGIRALRAMGYEPAVIHLNEGHAALAPLELAHEQAADGSEQSLADALQRARSRTVFTTHTPVPAGNDTYPAHEIESAIGRLSAQLGCPIDQLTALGHDHGAEPSAPFGVTQAALRMSRAANAVSRRHGEVAREMWNPLWPESAPQDVTCPPGWGRRCVSCWTATCPRTGASRQPTPRCGRPLPGSRQTSCGRRGAGSARTWWSSCAPAAWPSGWDEATCAATSTPPRRRSIRRS